MSDSCGTVHSHWIQFISVVKMSADYSEYVLTPYHIGLK